MKTLSKLVVVVALILIAIYYIGGLKGWNPTQQGKDARAAIGPGMTWNQVFNVTGEPRKYQPMMKKTRRFGGETVEYFEPGPLNTFNPDTFGTRVKENALPHGFLCTFRYSGSVAFTVSFDGTGTVVGITDAVTMSKLLQYDDE